MFWKRLTSAAIVLNGGVLVYLGMGLYQANEKCYENLIMPVFRLLPAETAHRLSVKLAKYKLVPKPSFTDPISLKTKLWGRTFSNPVGMAAGFDKHGECVDGLLRIGFGFVEVGSVTPEPQPGNDKPRVFRLVQDSALINRYGFNSDGHSAVLHRLRQRDRARREGDCCISDERNMLNVNFWTSTSGIEERSHLPGNIAQDGCATNRLNDCGIIGVNLGKNKLSPDPVEDYVRGVRTFGCLADYLVINVSSPNTVGLSDLQGRKQLELLLDQVMAEREMLSVTPKPPLLLKIAPDLGAEDLADIAEVVMRKEGGVDGLVVTNSTVARPNSLRSASRKESGGLSGQPLASLSTKTVRSIYRLTNGRIPIIGVGGIGDGKDAYEKIKAGASLLELYTVLIYKGPPVVTKIKRELADLLQRDGYSSISEAVGVEATGEALLLPVISMSSREL